MKVLVWQWGRHGAGPLIAVALARALEKVPGIEPILALSTGAELLGLDGAPGNDLPIRTYNGLPGFLLRLLLLPVWTRRLARRIRRIGADVAICAMPAPLDLAMATGLRRAGIPFAVVVHDAQLHPGDSFPLQIALQRMLLARADMLFALSAHVAGQLERRTRPPGQPLLRATLPPLVLGPRPPPVRANGGPWRLLSFGRLMPYKGLDLLADAVAALPPGAPFELRVVGAGPESADLARLRTLPNVTVENRWVPEAELNDLLGWADALILTHREASQSGVAAAALAAGRWIVSTRVGGLAEQLEGRAMAVLCAPDGPAIAAAIASLPGREARSEPIEDWTATAATIAAGLRHLTPPA